MLFGFVLPGYEFDADLEETELPSGEVTPRDQDDEKTRFSSATPANA